VNRSAWDVALWSELCENTDLERQKPGCPHVQDEPMRIHSLACALLLPALVVGMEPIPPSITTGNVPPKIETSKLEAPPKGPELPAGPAYPAWPSAGETLHQPVVQVANTKSRFEDEILAPSARCVEVEAEYLLWWSEGARFSHSLITQGNQADARPGVFGQPGTVVLFGSNEVDYNAQSGLRGFVNWRPHQYTSFALQLGGMYLSQTGSTFAASGDGTFPVGQSFFNPLEGRPGVFLVSDGTPGARLAGGVSISTTSSLYGSEANLLYDVDTGCSNNSLRLLGGFRFFGLRESYRETAVVRELDGNVLTLAGQPTLQIITEDLIRTRNEFYGGQIGARYGMEFGLFDVDVWSKVGLGVSCQRITATGVSRDATQSVVGGLRVLDTNQGSYNRSEFAVLPEFGANVGVLLSKHVRLQVGYTFLYLSSVARPGDQLDSVINPNRVPSDVDFGTAGGPNRPAITRSTSDFWAQGLNFGVQVNY
jgi:hypothetical protein